MKFLRFLLSEKVMRLLGGAVVGGMITVVLALVSAHMVEKTSGAEFCGSCHEMEVFVDAWEEGPHGTMKDGTIAAKCADCHLPHDNVVNYLYVKGVSGAKDVYAHARGTQPDWIEELEHSEEYTYESGCRKCHVELVAPDISIKAYMAHRDYLTGETKKTCISCHKEVGHAHLIDRLEELKKTEES